MFPLHMVLKPCARISKQPMVLLYMVYYAERASRAQYGGDLVTLQEKQNNNHHRSKLRALSSAMRDQIFGGVIIFLCIPKQPMVLEGPYTWF